MKYKGILLAVDFDGTIAQNAKISKENADAVRYFESEGGIFTIASGRQVAFFDDIKKEVPFTAPYVGLNGTVVFDSETKEIIISTAMTKESIVALFNTFKSFDDLRFSSFFSDNIVMRFYKEENFVSLKFIDENNVNFVPIHEERFESLNDVNIKLTVDGRIESGIPMFDEFINGNIYKIVLFADPKAVSEERVCEMRDRIRKECGHLASLCRSWPHGIEMQHLETSKGRALNFVKEHTGAHLLIAMGNYENDISMLKDADIGVAVADSSPDCLAVADLTVCKCSDHAVADFIYNYLPGIV